MDKAITDASVRCLEALFEFERTGRAEDKARFEAALVAIGARPGGQNHLFSVPNCGARRTRGDQRHMTAAQAEMCAYARNIRAFREGKVVAAKSFTAKLRLVPNCGSLFGVRETEPPSDPSAA